MIEKKSMGSRLKFVFAVFLLFQLLDFSRKNKIGIAYGRDAINILSHDRVTQLVQSHNIQHLRIYDTQPYNSKFPEKGTNSNESSWCVASSTAPESDLQKALDWACGPGEADCSAIQPGQPCFEPNTLISHASFAFNNYYQNHGATADSCNFGGTGTQMYTDPSYGNCIYS
ncbi:hypothetical protein V6N13_002518 [Hibiscus sabdariffa]|uniref:X8 domain-containing protein n=1 Tax=Hibiscus sabdariffa TaxID=183260 RepID=A0ABR2C378_9ROSI